MGEQMDSGAAETFRLIYRSRSRIPAEERAPELASLFTGARSNNKKTDITGALLVSDERFVQVLEGDPGRVQTLYRVIQEDPRHEEVELVESGTVDGRVFEHWSMARVGPEGDADIPLIAKVGEVAPVTAWTTTTEQERLLARMRQAAEETSGP